MKLTSSTFKNGTEIPMRHTMDGEHYSPPLMWASPPANTKSFALVCEDLDAPSGGAGQHFFVHWLIYNIPATSRSLPEGISSQEQLNAPIRADQGLNSFGTLGYSGPLPPEESDAHRYVFRLYALDTEVLMSSGADVSEFSENVGRRVLGTAEITGLYRRKKFEQWTA